MNWKALGADVEIFIFGTGAGIAESAAVLGYNHVPNVAASETGVPLFGAIADFGAQHGRFDQQVYLNGDVLLPADFIDRLSPVTLARYLVIGQRIDLSRKLLIPEVEFEWAAWLRRVISAGDAVLHAPTGIDYFVFKRGMWTGLAPLAIGRGGYDNALLEFCFARRFPVVDATFAVPALHQWHDYSHVANGLHGAHGGAEAVLNKRTHKISHSPPIISDADLVIKQGRLVRGNCRGDWLRAFELRLRYDLRCRICSLWVRWAWRTIEAFKCKHPQYPQLTQLLTAWFEREGIK